MDKKAKIVEGTEAVEAKQDKSGETAERRIKRRRRTQVRSDAGETVLVNAGVVQGKSRRK